MDDVRFLVENSQIIATANEEIYKKISHDHPHVFSRFALVHLEELPQEQIRDILSKAQDHIATKLNVSWENGTVQEVYQLAKQYVSDIAFPAKGLLLLEEAVMYAVENHQPTVTADALKAIIAQKTKIPLTSMTEFEKKDLSALADNLKQFCERTK
jgi:ATP-dependent Clp protease ATP-binding subunit ClpA